MPTLGRDSDPANVVEPTPPLMATHPRPHYRRTITEPILLLEPLPRDRGRRRASPSRTTRIRLLGGASATGLAAVVAIVVASQIASPLSSSAHEGAPGARGAGVSIDPTPSPPSRDASATSESLASSDGPHSDGWRRWGWTPATAAASPTASASAASHDSATPAPSATRRRPTSASRTSPSASASATSDPTSEPTSDPTSDPTSNSASGLLRGTLSLPFAANSPWNTSIGSGAAYSSADASTTRSLQNSSGAYINSTAYSVPITVASGGDPIQSVSVSGPAGAAHHMPTNAQIAQGSDATMVVIDGSKIYEYWQASRDGNGHYSAHYGTVVDLAGSGITGGVRASGFSVAAGLIRKGELTDINHALVMALSGDQLRLGPVWPATIQDGDAGSSYHGSVPIGSLVAIPQSVDVGSLGLSTEGRALARALQQYGAYVGDRSSQLTLYAEPSADTSALDRMRQDLRSKLVPLLRLVTNSSASAVGGPGSRIAK